MIVYKSEEEMQGIRKSNQIVAKILSELRNMVKSGIKTKELDEYAEMRCKEMNAVPAFKGYRGFPCALCTSVNEEIVHGIPSSRKLKEGDIISLDFGVKYEGFFGDAAVTYSVGKIPSPAQKIIKVVKESLFRGIEQAKNGNRISDISHAVQSYVESKGYSVIRNFVGHGIGFSLHEEPQVPNFGMPGRGPKIKTGMVVAIEPMIAVGDWSVEILEDGWTAITRDRGLSAHYEHTIAVTSTGTKILSLLDKPGKAVSEESFYA